MTERIALVTGATDGIGRQTALELLQKGWTVVVHGRSEAKVSATLEHLAAVGPGRALPAVADLSSQKQIRTLAERLKGEVPRLDVLLNNAGVFLKERQLSEDGIELTLAVNHLAPVLLTRLLEPLLTGAPSRVINVASVAHQRSLLDLDDLQLRQGFEGYRAYANSKLCNVLHANTLARLVPKERYTANALHPGVIGTKLLATGFGMDGASLESGARTSVVAATSPELADVTGAYLVDGVVSRASAAARDRRIQDALWQVSLQMVGEA
ncbi:MAG: SDR family NAD(P)-dependent oxidoreductase [Deltaproteobacteria bacterium]|nr:SDR family NAD(P)-dependent oxidoreductase [Deltaproteobacteria bacterium]